MSPNYNLFANLFTREFSSVLTRDALMRFCSCSNAICSTLYQRKCHEIVEQWQEDADKNVQRVCLIKIYFICQKTEIFHFKEIDELICFLNVLRCKHDETLQRIECTTHCFDTLYVQVICKLMQIFKHTELTFKSSKYGCVILHTSFIVCEK